MKNQYETLESDILDWNWDDPISLKYKEIFISSNVIEMKKSETDIIKDLDFRQKNSIPPGFKDASKQDGGIGDLMIWQTMIEISKQLDKDLVFVSNDKKSDWYYRQDNSAIYPRFELLDEFRRETEGKSINIIDFPKFLEIFKVDDKIVEDVKSIIKDDVDNIISGELIEESEEEFIYKNHPSIEIGKQVHHKKFGYGTMISMDGMPNQPIAAIKFNDGIKRLMLRFAKLHIVE